MTRKPRLASPGRRLLPALTALTIVGGLSFGEVRAGPILIDREDARRMVREEAARTTVPPDLAMALAKVQSDFRSDAVSSRGARGLLQVMPSTARTELQVDPEQLWEPRFNVEVGLDYLSRLHRRYGRWDLALSHYYCGGVEGTGETAQPKAESRAFVDSVLRWQERYRAAREEKRSRLTVRAAAAPPPTDRPTDWQVRWHDPSRPVVDPEWQDIDTRRALARSGMDDFSPRLILPPGR